MTVSAASARRAPADRAASTAVSGVTVSRLDAGVPEGTDLGSEVHAHQVLEALLAPAREEQQRPRAVRVEQEERGGLRRGGAVPVLAVERLPAPQARRAVAQDAADPGSSRSEASIRAVTVSRVSDRPSVKNSHTSSRLASPSTTPTARALRSRTQPRNSCARSPAILRGSRERVVLRQSQSLGRDDVPCPPGIVPRHGHGSRDGRRFVTVQRQGLERRSWTEVGVPLRHHGADDSAQAPTERTALDRRVPPSEVYVEQARHDVRPLDRAPDAVDAPRESVQHVDSCMRRTY